MKKKVALLLAGMLCIGCFAACGGGDKENSDSDISITSTDGGNGGESSITSGDDSGLTSDMTQEELYAAFSDVDVSHSVFKRVYRETNSAETLLWEDETTVCLDGNKSYMYSVDNMLQEGGTYEQNTYIDYMAEIDGVSYSYYESSFISTENVVWEKCENESEFSEGIYEYTLQISMYLDLAKTGWFLAEYDAEKDAYVLDMSQDGNTYVLTFVFKDGALYQLSLFSISEKTEEDELIVMTASIEYTFEGTTVELPDEAGLNALIAGETEE